MNEILALARHQGYVTTTQALALGAHEHTLGRLARLGLLTRAARGTYLVPGERSAAEAHALMTRASLDDDPHACASHHSALALHGVALYGVPWGQVHVSDARPGGRRTPGRHRHRLRDDDAVTTVDGYRTVGLPLALAQVAAAFGVAPGLVALDDALHHRRCGLDEVAAIVDSGRLRCGVGAARRVVALADGRAESPGESRLRAIVAAGPWEYDLQVDVGGGFRVDLLVAGLVALEFDGATKYGGADGRAALVAEKQREDWIRARGFGFMRVMWAQLDYPVALRHTLVDTVATTRAAGGPRMGS